MDMTLQQAMKVAAELEERGCLNEPAKAARTLLAHINSLASPQVTDEQIVADALEMFGRHREFSNCFDDINERGMVAFVRRYIPAPAAPPAAETRTCKCNLRTKLVGDGCDVCNPDYSPAPENRHLDEIAVYEFADAMVAKMAEARAKGRSGWQECDPVDLSTMLREHVEKGDPRDVANFCMMLWHHKAPISAAPQEAKPVAAESMPKEWLHLYICINHLMAHLGAYGEITTRFTVVNATMDALAAIDGGTVSKRAIELHDKASMPLFDAVNLAVGEAGQPALAAAPQEQAPAEPDFIKLVDALNELREECGDNRGRCSGDYLSDMVTPIISALQSQPQQVADD